MGLTVVIIFAGFIGMCYLLYRLLNPQREKYFQFDEEQKRESGGPGEVEMPHLPKVKALSKIPEDLEAEAQTSTTGKSHIEAVGGDAAAGGFSKQGAFDMKMHSARE